MLLWRLRDAILVVDSVMRCRCYVCSFLCCCFNLLCCCGFKLLCCCDCTVFCFVVVIVCCVVVLLFLQ